jgi:arabinan endo-1,5-alpha-L-arabinosidase
MGAPQDWRNLQYEHAVSPQDVKYQFTGEVSYDLPVGWDRAVKLNRFEDAFLGAWTSNGIFYWSDCIPIASPLVGAGTSYFNQRPDLTCDPSKGAPHTVNTWFNPNCFAIPQSPFVAGSALAYLDHVRTMGAKDVDISLYKSFSFGEARQLHLEASSYNIANRPQFGMPGVPGITSVQSNPAEAALFGQITSTVNSPRQFQFGARFTFQEDWQLKHPGDGANMDIRRRASTDWPGLRTGGSMCSHHRKRVLFPNEPAASSSIRFWVASLVQVALVIVCKPLHAQDPQALSLTGDYQGTHDPSIIEAGGTGYVFATGKARDGGQFQIRCSPDLHAWKFCGHVFDQIPGWIQKDSPGTKELWAPDISWENGEFRLYYAYSLFGKDTSGIALAINKTLDPSSPDYKWIDRGLVLRSTAADDFNAIDPNLVLDDQHHAWLVFGSFWSGIKLRRLDDKTGLAADPRICSLATRRRPDNAAPPPAGLPPDWEAIEAPFIVHHGGYYYLFVSWDLCYRGIHSTFRTMVGRSTRVTGPYIDNQGMPMMQGGGTPLLSANSRWLGPDGESILMQPSGRDIIVFHAYDVRSGLPALQISTLTWRDGWPHAALSQEP